MSMKRSREIAEKIQLMEEKKKQLAIEERKEKSMKRSREIAEKIQLMKEKKKQLAIEEMKEKKKNRKIEYEHDSQEKSSSKMELPYVKQRRNFRPLVLNVGPNHPLVRDRREPRIFGGRTIYLLESEYHIANYARNLPRNIPPHDSTADTPEKAYPLYQILCNGDADGDDGHMTIKILLKFLKLVRSGAEIRIGTHPRFVVKRVHKLLELKDKEERKKLACIFAYTTFLIFFKNLRSVQTATRKMCRIPAIIFRRFLAMFADSEECKPCVTRRDLLISYVLVLTLIADGYRTDISDIAMDLRMTGLALKEYYLNLGCKVEQEGKSVICTLSAPLKFPESSMKDMNA